MKRDRTCGEGICARTRPDGIIEVSGPSRTEEFSTVAAGVGWPEASRGCICVLGERLDGRYHALWEREGGLWEIGNAAIEAKDRLLADRIFVDARDELATSYLRSLEGLTFHEEEPGETEMQGNHPRPRVRRNQHATAVILPVRDRICANYRSALERTREIIMSGRLLVHRSNCPRLVYTLRQPVDELLTSPVMKALVFVLTAMEAYRGAGDDVPVCADPWYRNPEKKIL